MLPAKTLLRLAYKAFQSGAKDDATALTVLALSSADASEFFSDASDNPAVMDLKKEHEATSPVPKVDDKTKSDCDPGSESASLTSLLENGEGGTAGGPKLHTEQQGFNVKGTYVRLQQAIATLEARGHKDLAVSLQSCLR